MNTVYLLLLIGLISTGVESDRTNHGTDADNPVLLNQIQDSRQNPILYAIGKWFANLFRNYKVEDFINIEEERFRNYLNTNLSYASDQLQEIEGEIIIQPENETVELYLARVELFHTLENLTSELLKPTPDGANLTSQRDRFYRVSSKLETLEPGLDITGTVGSSDRSLEPLVSAAYDSLAVQSSKEEQTERRPTGYLYLEGGGNFSKFENTMPLIELVPDQYPSVRWIGRLGYKHPYFELSIGYRFHEPYPVHAQVNDQYYAMYESDAFDLVFIPYTSEALGLDLRILAEFTYGKFGEIGSERFDLDFKRGAIGLGLGFDNWNANQTLGGGFTGDLFLGRSYRYMFDVEKDQYREFRNLHGTALDVGIWGALGEKSGLLRLYLKGHYWLSNENRGEDTPELFAREGFYVQSLLRIMIR